MARRGSTVSAPKGILFIGDPHVSSVRPGRRKDEYLESVIGKLRRASEICWERSFQPVILGDLFHRAKENHLPTLAQLFEVLGTFPVRPLVLGGNHDKGGAVLQDADALSLFAQTGVIEVLDGPARAWCTIETPEGPIHLWGAPYGSVIPDSIEAEGEGKVVLVTHHDLAFQGAYPGAELLKEIRGCDMVVNGHMHFTTPSVQKGATWWHNPGNIEPISIDCRDHKPAVWAWMAGATCEALERIDVPHDPDCFDLTGIAVEASDAVAAVAALPESQFAELLSQDEWLGAAGVENDGEAFLEDITTGLDELGAPEPVRAILFALAKGQEPLAPPAG